MTIESFKLVRDQIPDIIHQNGSTCDIVVMDKEEYEQALREKLIEEACEVAIADDISIIEELADLYEVMDALIISYGIPLDRVRELQAHKRNNRGGFAQRIKLLRVHENNN